MKSSILALFGVIVTLTSAQSPNLSSLPQCAQACVGNSINVPGCNTLDIACICSNSNYIGSLSCCLAQSCSPADQQSAINFAQQLCSSAGVTVPNTVSCASSLMSSTMMSSMSAASNSSASATPASNGTASTTASQTSSASAKGSGSATSGGSGAGTGTASASAQVSSSTGLANRLAAGMGLVGGAGIAALALL